MRSLTTLILLLTLALAVTGCAGGLLELPVLSAAGSAAVMGAGAGYFGPKLLSPPAQAGPVAGQYAAPPGYMLVPVPQAQVPLAAPLAAPAAPDMSKAKGCLIFGDAKGSCSVTQ